MYHELNISLRTILNEGKYIEAKVVLPTVTPATEENVYSSLKRGLSSVVNLRSLLNAMQIVAKVNLCKLFSADSGAELIADVSSILKPDLCVIDRLVAVEEKGPSFADRRK